jgi:hypothetical protein
MPAINLQDDGSDQGLVASLALTVGWGFGIPFPHMTTEGTSRMELLARERLLVELIQNLQEQLRVVRAALAAPAHGTVLTAPPALIVPPASAVNGSTDAAVSGAASASLVPPVPESPLVKKSRNRGWFKARIEQLIDEGGPTFSYHTVFEAYKVKWGWRRWPTESSIGATVWKIVRQRGHPVLHPGSGRRSTVYQKEIRT